MFSQRTIARRDLYQRYSLASICIDGKWNNFEEPQLVLKDSCPSRRSKKSHRLLMVHVKDKAAELESIDLETTFSLAPIGRLPGPHNTIDYSEQDISITLRYSQRNSAAHQTSTLRINFKTKQDFNQVLNQITRLKLNVHNTCLSGAPTTYRPHTSALQDRDLQSTPPGARPTTTIEIPHHLSEGWYKVTRVRSASSTPVSQPVAASLDSPGGMRVDAEGDARADNRALDHIIMINQDSLAEASDIFNELQDQCSKDVHGIVDEGERFKIYMFYAKQWEKRLLELEVAVKGRMREVVKQTRLPRCQRLEKLGV